MKSLISKLVIISILQGFAYNLQAHVELDYPVGAETFTTGEVITIQWHVAVPHITLNWDLFFSDDGGATWETIQLNIPANQLTYQWVVPILTTGQARVSVIQDNDGVDYQDESLNFTIQAAPMQPFMEVAPIDTTIECSSNQEANIQTWLDNHGGALAIGFCGDFVWTDSYDGLSNDCGATGTTMVFFTATDECGSTTMAANVTIVDTESPILNVSASDLVVECAANGNVIALNNWLANKGGAAATDICGNVTWTNNYSGISDDCGISGSMLVTFTATDNCGNTVITTATYRIEDHIPPTLITAAHDYTIECGSPNQQSLLQNWLNSHGGGLASDLCGNVSWINNYSNLSNDCGATGSASVIFTAMDDCGNFITTTAILTVEDKTAPGIVAQALDTVIHCGIPNLQSAIQSWLSNHGGADASDLCGGVTWTNDYIPVLDICTDTASQVVSFIVTDECGNSSATTAAITLLSNPVTSIPVFPNFDFSISPNPVSEILKVDIDKNESLPFHLILFDTWGKPVLFTRENAKEIYIPVDQFTPGVYFLLVKTKHGVLTRKVIIN